MYHFTITGVLLSTIVALSLGATCEVSDINKCDSYVTPYISEAKIKYYTREELSALCQHVPTYVSCMKNVKSACDTSGRLLIEGAISSNIYLCNDGFEIMATNGDCFSRQAVQDVDSRCSSGVESRLLSAQSTSQKCSIVSAMLKCYFDGIAHECGNDAGFTIYKANLLVLGPLYKYIGCDLARNGPHRDNENDGGQGGDGPHRDNENDGGQGGDGPHRDNENDGGQGGGLGEGSDGASFMKPGGCLLLICFLLTSILFWF